ncbi:hypothetical protein H4O09_01250 [Stenotrophomonas sp. W1S232]|jgi:hypothetical protein|uniref:Uncharacterized protein n=1 Tax=Stenotrophomonas koreensis TaxID=266128 RepID=A0A7W3UYN9_9GAMM|nr:hypothetical protein [Stenotrophomonas koreensis]MBB1115692.1 hypothetical protein [Stenotrophomonas koreensis]
MSKNSKAKRDTRKKQAGKRPFLRLNQREQVQNHAVLVDEQNQVVAAIGLQNRQWLLAIGGQTMGSAENPVPMLAMLQHLANVQKAEGRTVTLETSPALQQIVASLAEADGVSAEDYIGKLVAEFDQAKEAAEAEEAEEGEASEADEAIAVAEEVDETAGKADKA